MSVGFALVINGAVGKVLMLMLSLPIVRVSNGRLIVNRVGGAVATVAVAAVVLDEDVVSLTAADVGVGCGGAGVGLPKVAVVVACAHSLCTEISVPSTHVSIGTHFPICVLLMHHSHAKSRQSKQLLARTGLLQLNKAAPAPTNNKPKKNIVWFATRKLSWKHTHTVRYSFLSVMTSFLTLLFRCPPLVCCLRRVRACVRSPPA